MEQFTDNFRERIEQRYWVDKNEVENRLKRKELTRIPSKFKSLNPNFRPQLHAHYYRLAYRQNSNPTNRQTLLTTVLPPNVFLGHSLHYIRPIHFDGEKYVRSISYNEILYLCGMFNSFTVDYIVRKKVDKNISYYHINGLPVPRFDKNNPLHQKIFQNSTMLICTTDDFIKLREEIGVSEFVTDPAKRIGLQAQINACAAKIYGLTQTEFEFVLETFPSGELKQLKELTLDEFSLI